MKKLLLLLLIAAFGLSTTTSNAQDKSSKDKDDTKSYTDFITDKAVSSEGLFSTHKVKDKHYFEIPDNLLEKEILVVSRISGFVKNLNFGGAGVKSRPQQVIRFQKMDDNILMRSVSFSSVADEGSPIYESVCLLYTSPSPRDLSTSRMPSSA